MKKRTPATKANTNERRDAIRPFVNANLITAVTLSCIVCLSHWYKVADPVDWIHGGRNESLDPLEHLSELAVRSGWSVVTFSDRKGLVEGLACPQCAGDIRHPRRPSSRVHNSVLSPAFIR